MKPQSLFGLDGLADLGQRSAIAMRPTLLQVLTDLYVHRLRHTPEEERRYTELALRLLEAVDVATRVAVAGRLARHSSPPLRVLQYLAGDVAEVAAVLQSHPLLRSAPLVDETPPPPAAISSVAGIADDGCRFAEQPRAVDSVRAAELNEQFFAANSHERRLILRNLDVVAPIPVWLVGVSRDPTVSRRLEAAALARNREDFAQHLAAALQISREQARRIVHDDLGEPVTLAGKVLAVPRDVLYRILMFINPAIGHSVERVHSLAALFDEMPLAAAVGMVAIWQALQKGERAAARYQPVTWDETRPRARPAGATRAPAVPRTSERRSAS
jgi:signal transduction histidine kinase